MGNRKWEAKKLYVRSEEVINRKRKKEVRNQNSEVGIKKFDVMKL